MRCTVSDELRGTSDELRKISLYSKGWTVAERGGKMFIYKGIKSNLPFINENLRDFPKIIDYLFGKYSVAEIDCEIILHERSEPEFFEKIIALGTDIKLNGKDLCFYQRVDYQFAHELTHAIQYSSGLIKIRRYPKEHPVEVDARQNARYVMRELLGYKDYDCEN